MIFDLNLKWWQKPIFAVLLIIAIGWRLPQFWLMVAALVLFGFGGWYLFHHIAWVR